MRNEHIIREHGIELPDVVVPLITMERTGDDAVDGGEQFATPSTMSQTATIGREAPLIVFCGTSVQPTDIVAFSLESRGVLPTCRVTFNDTYNLIETLNRPETDNLVIIELISKVEHYDKIKMPFYMTSCSISGTQITLSCILNVASLYASQLHSFGITTTYDLFDEISRSTSLGFRTNTNATNDARCVYMPNVSYYDTIVRETPYTGRDEQIYDAYVDFRLRLNLINIYERFKTRDEASDMSVYVTSNIPQADGTSSDDLGNQPQYKTQLVFSNHNDARSTQLFIKSYRLMNTLGGNVLDGTDLVALTCDVTSSNTFEHVDTQIQDGNVSNDIFTRYTYLGEQCESNDANDNDARHDIVRPLQTQFFKNLMHNECVEITTAGFCLGVERYDQCDVLFYSTNDYTSSIQRENEENVSNDAITTNEAREVNETFAGTPVLNAMTSGRYTILDIRVAFTQRDGFTTTYTLTRDKSQASTYMGNQ